MKKWNNRAALVDGIGFFVGRCAFWALSPLGVGYYLGTYHQDVAPAPAVFLILLGMSSALPVVDLVKYAMIFLTISLLDHIIFRDNLRLNRNRRAAAGGVVTFALSLTRAFLFDQAKLGVWLALLEGAVVFFSAVIFQKGTAFFMYHRRREDMNKEELISISLLAACMVYSVPEPFGSAFSIGIFLSVLFTMAAGYKYGPGTGCVMAVVLGILCAYTSGKLMLFCGLCLLGICAGMFQEIGRIGTVAGCGVSGLVLFFLLEKKTPGFQGMEPVLAAFVFFLLLPGGLLAPVSEKERKRKEFERQSIQALTSRRFLEFSGSLEKLSQSFETYAMEKRNLGCDDMNGIFEEVSGQFCKGCDSMGVCWNDKYEQTCRLTQHMFAAAKQRGRLTRKDVPEVFRMQCVHADAFVEETNRSLMMTALNVSWYNRLLESRKAVVGQLEEISEIVRDFTSDLCETRTVSDPRADKLQEKLKLQHIQARNIVLYENKGCRRELHMEARMKWGRCVTTRELANIISQELEKRFKAAEQSRNVVTENWQELVFFEDTKYKVFTGVAKKNKDGEEISGDSFSTMELDSGEMILTLCDGMGSGKDAGDESRAVIDLLEDFMEAGFREQSAVHLINSVYALRNDGSSFSTIDMTVLNLFTGKCDFAKMGAAATYLKRRDRVELVPCESLPAGILGEAGISMAGTFLEDDSYVIMMTDGVVDAFPGEKKEEAVRDMIRSLKSRNPNEMAKEILSAALSCQDGSCMDDMTVITAGIWEKH